MAYDYCCEVLAKYFLTDRLIDAERYKKPTDEDVRSLAEHIQKSAEDWLEANPVKEKRNAAKA